ncbi:MAG: hypothetical protein V4689_09690 [Verrucomicrobiota bacterium]
MKPSPPWRLFGAGLASTLAISASASFAATVANPQSNDIFLGFRASGGTGASTSYLVNLGPYSQFSGAAPDSTISLSGVGDIGADLVATFCANWNTRQDLSWGIFGVGSSSSATVYASKEQSTPGTPSEPWTLLDTTTRSSTYSQITSVINITGGYRGRESTANSTVGVLQSNSAQASSYNYQVATNGTTDFGSVSQWSSIEGDFGSGVSGTRLDLFRINASAVTSPGSFSIAPTGSLSFTAIPEPSAALMGLAGTALLLIRRRATH